MLPYPYHLLSNQADPSIMCTVHWYSSPISTWGNVVFKQNVSITSIYISIIRFSNYAYSTLAHMGYLDIVSCVRVVWVFNTFLHPMHKLQVVIPCRVFKRYPNPSETRTSAYPSIYEYIHCRVHPHSPGTWFLTRTP